MSQLLTMLVDSSLPEWIMPEPKEPQPPKPGGEQSADDLLSEMDDASLHGDWQAERERFRQRLTFRLGDSFSPV